MKGFIKKYGSDSVLLFLALVLLAVSCSKDSPGKPVELEDFVQKKECGLVGYGGYLFKYSDEKCQLGINRKRRYVRMQNDDQTDYVHVVLLKFPSTSDVQVGVDLKYRLGEDEISNTMQMECVHFSGNNVWLWNNVKKMGIILPLGR